MRRTCPGGDTPGGAAMAASFGVWGRRPRWCPSPAARAGAEDFDGAWLTSENPFGGHLSRRPRLHLVVTY